jgi:hypothetical protein
MVGDRGFEGCLGIEAKDAFGGFDANPLFVGTGLLGVGFGSVDDLGLVEAADVVG